MVTCSWGTPTKEQIDALYRLGDVNRDGSINQKDLDLINEKFGWKGPPGGVPEDLNADGWVNIVDVTICSKHQGLDICTYFSHILIVESEPQGAPFTINDVATATRYSRTLQDGIYTIVMPTIFNSYSFKQWEDGSVDPTRTINLTADTLIKAIYVPVAAPPPPTPTPPTALPPTVEISPPPAPPPIVMPPVPEAPPPPITPETAGLIVLGVLAVVTVIGVGIAIWYFGKPPS